MKHNLLHFTNNPLLCFIDYDYHKPGLEIPVSRAWVRVKKPQECLLGLFCSLLRMNKHAMLGFF